MFSDIGICAGKCSFLRYEELNFMMESGLWDGNEEDMMKTGLCGGKWSWRKKRITAADSALKLKFLREGTGQIWIADADYRCRFFEKGMMMWKKYCEKHDVSRETLNIECCGRGAFMCFLKYVVCAMNEYAEYLYKNNAY